jgi:hypothetical protein
MKKVDFLSPKAYPLDLAKSQEKSLFGVFSAPKRVEKRVKNSIFERPQKSAFFTIFRLFYIFLYFIGIKYFLCSSASTSPALLDFGKLQTKFPCQSVAPTHLKV